MNNIVMLQPDRLLEPQQLMHVKHRNLSGRYQLENILGIGGMNVVYRATDNMLQTFGTSHQHVAVKMVSESLRDNLQAEKLLFNEYVLASRLKHPNIVAIRHFDVCREQEQAYLVMDWVEGLLLEELFYQQTIDVHSALELARQLVNAVHFCHQHQIVHGDLKLANIIVSPSNHLTLIDFGISRHISEKQNGIQTIRACSHRFAAPEVIQEEETTLSTDIFSLSCVLYRLFAGEHPFPDTAEEAMTQARIVPFIFGKRHPLDKLLQIGLRWNKHARVVTSFDFHELFQTLKPEDLKRRWF